MSKKRSMESTPPTAKRRCDDLFDTDDLSGGSLYESFQRRSDSDQRVFFEILGSFPRIDRMVLQHYDRDNRLTKEELAATNELQEKLQKIWSSAKPDPDVVGQRQQSVSLRWDENQLRWNPSAKKFELSDALRESDLLYHISSSLLLYRVMLLFVDFESISTDGYKSCWEVLFRHADGFTSLRLWDSKGRTKASFAGSEKSQKDALELINLLTTYKFPHTYDGTVAGTVA